MTWDDLLHWTRLVIQDLKSSLVQIFDSFISVSDDQLMLQDRDRRWQESEYGEEEFLLIVGDKSVFVSSDDASVDQT